MGRPEIELWWERSLKTESMGKRCFRLSNGAHGYLPTGSYCALDFETRELAVRTSGACLSEIQALFDEFERYENRSINLSVEVYKVGAAMGSDVMRRSVQMKDHGPIVEELNQATEDNRAVRLHSNQASTTHGRRFVIATTSVDQTSADDTETEWTPCFRWEVDPYIGSDQLLIDLNMALTVNSPWWSKKDSTPNLPAGVSPDSPHQIQSERQIQTSITLEPGKSRLVSAWNSPGESFVVLAFVTGNLAVIRPLPTSAAERLLAENEAALTGGVQLESPSMPVVPKGMELRRYRVPPDFLSLGGGNPDPFVTSTGQSGPDAKSILEAQGIPFPEGSSAAFFQSRGELQVINVPDSMNLIETFGCNWGYYNPPRVSCVLRIVEANSKVVRAWQKRSIDTVDHRAAWAALTEGEHRIVTEVMLETKNRQRARGFSGRVRSDSEIGLAVDQTNPAKKNTTAISNGGEQEFDPDGVEWEIEPAVGADGTTVEVNTAISLIERFDTSIEPRDARFERSEEYLQTSVTIANGTKRWIGVLDPRGGAQENGQKVLHAVFLEIVASCPWNEE